MAAPAFIAWRSRDWWYVALSALLVFVLTALVTLLTVVYSAGRVDGDSMLPVLEHGDRILVRRGYDAPNVGDIIRFSALDQSGRTISVIKRVVALPGDSVELVGDTAYVNGVISDAAPRPLMGTDSRRLGPLVVPEGTVYVLGDNRPVSLDSRFTGPVPLETVEGRVSIIITPLKRAQRID